MSVLYIKEKVLPHLKRKTGNEARRRIKKEPKWKVKLRKKINLYKKKFQKLVNISKQIIPLEV